jgi:aminoglycoside phosphotransferase (APT) family kinase protein
MTKMHADEVDVDETLVRRLVAAQFPEWADFRLEPVFPRGTDNALYRLGDDMVVRLPRSERTTATLAKERSWLPLLAPHLPVAVPVPLADGAPGEAYPFAWCVYSWLEGETATTLGDPGELAGFIGALQRIDPAGGPPPGAHNFFRGAPLATRDAVTRTSLATLGASAAVWEAAVQAPEWDGAAVWIHGDLDARNLLVAGGRLSGVIDWGGLGLGDPACDVMVAWKVLSAHGRERFRTALAVDDATWTRARGWALSTAANALTYYTDETNPTLVHEARRWLAETLAESASR